MIRVPIDLGLRIQHNQTYVWDSEIFKDSAPGTIIEVYEDESGLTGKAVITKLSNGLVYLFVDWASLK